VKTGVSVDRRHIWMRRLSDPWGTLLDWLGDGTVGGHSVPSSWRTGKIRGGLNPNRTIGLSIDNDAFGLVGWNRYDDGSEGDEPLAAFSLSRSEAHALAWWILQWWAAEWFGLRRAAYYFALHRHISSWKRP
jgi:hypothetical protein